MSQVAQCPVCGAPIAEDFGIVECESCKAQLVIHLDGRVEHAGNQISDEDEKVIVDDGGEPPVFVEPMREFEMEPEVFADEATQPAAASPTFMPPPIPELEPEREPEPDPLSVLDMPDEVPADTYVNAKNSAPNIASPDLADVSRFANSGESGGRDGSLRYTLFIEGIDTADVREAFKEAITDKKLLWDTDSILRSIRKGEVKIENVSSAKAHVIVSRLKLLPITVSWEQHAIHES